MRKTLLVVGVVALMPFAAAFAASNAADVVSARAFVRALYDRYQRNGSFAVLADEEESKYFAADTLGEHTASEGRSGRYRQGSRLRVSGQRRDEDNHPQRDGDG